MRIHLSECGDTIVEVLIVIVIVSGVLGTAFITLQRSTNNARQAQERSQAVKFIESQTERLKGLNDDPSIFTQNKAFCITGANAVTNATNPSRGVDTIANPYLSFNSDIFSQYVASCTDSSEGIPYYFSIQRNTDSNGGYIFTVRVRWNRAGGGTDNGHEEASVVYRLWQ